MNDNAIPPGSPPRNPYGPVTPSEMFERTFKLLRENPGLFFGIVLVVIAAEIVVGGLLGGSGFWLGRSGGAAAPLAEALFLVPVALAGGALIYVLTAIVQGGLFVAARAKLGANPMTVGEACSVASSHVGRLVGISILVALRILGYMLLVFIPLGILVALIPGVGHVLGQFSIHPGMGSALTAGIVVVFLFLLFLVVYICMIFWLAIRYSLSIPACLEEGLPITDSIRRSISLSKGSRGRLLALFVGLAVVWIAMTILTAPLQMMATHAGAGHGGVLIFVAAAIRILFSWLLIAFMGVGTAICYFDLRARKDGLGTMATAPSLQPPQIFPAAAADLPIKDLPIS